MSIRSCERDLILIYGVILIEFFTRFSKDVLVGLKVTRAYVMAHVKFIFSSTTSSSFEKLAINVMCSPSKSTAQHHRKGIDKKTL